MDKTLRECLINAGVKESVVSILEDEEVSHVLIEGSTKSKSESNKKNFILLKELMGLTYPYRRQGLVQEPKRLEEILLEYPALQLFSEVRS